MTDAYVKIRKIRTPRSNLTVAVATENVTKLNDYCERNCSNRSRLVDKLVHDFLEKAE